MCGGSYSCGDRTRNMEVTVDGVRSYYRAESWPGETIITSCDKVGTVVKF